MRFTIPKNSLIQFGKFGAVGLINTGVDFGVFNLLIAIFKNRSLTHTYIYIKGISFIVAVTISYFLNKRFVFQKDGAVGAHKRLAFVGISIVSLVLNTFISSGIFRYASPHFLGHEVLVANASAVIGTLIVFLFNFFGYKHIVFTK